VTVGLARLRSMWIAGTPPRRCDRDAVDAPPLSGVESIDRIYATVDAPGASLHGFVAQRIRETLYRLARRDRIPVEV